MAVAQFSGLASGIDSAALIDAIIEARETTNTIRRSEIGFLESENSALEELNTKILGLNDLIDNFRTVNGGGLSKKALSSDSNVVSAAASSDATNSAFSVSVASLANTATLSFADSYSSTSAVVSSSTSGNVEITVGTGDNAVTVTQSVTAGETTVQQLVDNINNDSNSSGRLSASLLNVGTGDAADYRIVLTSLKSGEDEGTLSASTSVLTQDTVSQATNAEFTLSGVTDSIQRSSNTIDDVIDGVTFQLLSTGSSATVTVTDDAESTSDAFKEIVDAYNDIVKFISDNDFVERVDDDEDVNNVFGSLAKTRVDDDFIFQFRSELVAADTANGTTVGSMADLGIVTNRDGTLSFDDEDFKEAIANDSLGVEELLTDFADAAAGVTGFLYDFTKLNGTIDTAKDANDSEIELLNEEIDALDRALSSQRASLEKQFVSLELRIGELQTQQASLTSVLSSL